MEIREGKRLGPILKTVIITQVRPGGVRDAGWATEETETQRIWQQGQWGRGGRLLGRRSRVSWGLRTAGMLGKARCCGLCFLSHPHYCCSVAKSRPPLCEPTDCSMPGFSILHYLLDIIPTLLHLTEMGWQLPGLHTRKGPSVSSEVSRGTEYSSMMEEGT